MTNQEKLSKPNLFQKLKDQAKSFLRPTLLKTSSPFEHISRIENPKTKLLTEIGTVAQSVGMSLAV